MSNRRNRRFKRVRRSHERNFDDHSQSNETTLKTEIISENLGHKSLVTDLVGPSQLRNEIQLFIKEMPEFYKRNTEKIVGIEL